MQIAVCVSGAERLESEACTLFVRNLPQDAEIDCFCFFWEGGPVGEEAAHAPASRNNRARASAGFSGAKRCATRGKLCHGAQHSAERAAVPDHAGVGVESAALQSRPCPTP